MKSDHIIFLYVCPCCLYRYPIIYKPILQLYMDQSSMPQWETDFFFFLNNLILYRFKTANDLEAGVRNKDCTI